MDDGVHAVDQGLVEDRDLADRLPILQGDE
jgi:hypothetical protein